MKWKKCCTSLSKNKSSEATTNNEATLKKCKTWPIESANTTSLSGEQKRGKGKTQAAPNGCFSVYVGPEKQRFVVRAELANHPLFMMLLEDAESEYGFNSQGPILLPCDVDLFYKVLAEMDGGDQIETPRCSFSSSPLVLLCSPRHHNFGGDNHPNYGGYKVLSPSRLLKLNR